MKVVKYGSLFVILLSICYFLYVARKTQIQDGNTMNLIALAEIVFVILITVVLLQIIVHDKKGKEGLIDSLKDSQIMIQLTNLDKNINDIIYAIMNDLVIIGSDPNTTHITISKNTTISKQHCKLYYGRKSMLIRDLDSEQGTFVNGERIKEKELACGDIIQLGNLKYQIEWKLYHPEHR